MTEAAAILATWATYKPVPTRNTLQLVLEVPLEQQEEVFRRLGYPVPGKETWVAVGLYRKSEKPEQEKPSRPFREMSAGQQAGLLCADQKFQEWLGTTSKEGAAHLVRLHCRVVSRADIAADPAATAKWQDLVQDYRKSTGQETWHP